MPTEKIHCNESRKSLSQQLLFEETCIFLVYFCFFWKDKPLLILNLFISQYLDQILPWR